MEKQGRIISMALSASIIFSSLMPVMALAADETNVALQPGSDGANTVGITASYSNEFSSFSEAVFDGKSDDGSGENKWYVPANGSDGAWINVDLNSVCTISSIKVYSGYGNITGTSEKLVSYDIYYSDDAVADASSMEGYTLLTSVTADNGLHEITFESVSARNVKVVSNQDTAFRIREIEIFGTLGSGSGDEEETERNVALNKQKVTGSYTGTDSGPVTAVTDGITDQSTGNYKYFVNTNNSNGAWINIDLEDEFLVSKVIVYSGYLTSEGDRLTDFDVYCTTDNVDDPSSGEYTKVCSVHDAAGVYEAVLDKPTLMRNVKILSNNTTQFRIREIEVIGRAPSGFVVADENASEFKGGETYSVTRTIMNATEEESDCIMVMALYDKDEQYGKDRFISAGMSEKKAIKVGEQQRFTAKIEVPDDVSDDSYIKIMTFEDLRSLNSLMNEEVVMRRQ